MFDRWWVYLILILIFQILISINSSNGQIVELPQGKIRGEIQVSREGRDYFEFLGIPYAKTPVGQLRFEPPQQLTDKWDGILRTNYLKDECLQLDILITGRITGSEDCLYLNIFTPRLNGGRNPLPVLVFIHGGFFMSGSVHNYHGKFFMDEDIVIVTPQYRLGAFGFLNTDDEVVRGNMGLKDLIMALNWVQENIISFGGDPDRVTIAGESAGAGIVHYFQISPLTKGLFHKAISASGSAVRVYSSTMKMAEQSRHLAKILDCPTGNSTKMVDCLKKVNSRSIVDVHFEALSPLMKNEYALYVPTIERIKYPDSVFPSDPRASLKRGHYHKNVPWMASVNAREGLLWVSRIQRERDLMKRIKTEWSQVLPSLLNYDPSRKDVAEKVKKYYFGDLPELPELSDRMENYTNMFSDRMFFLGIHRAAQLQSKFSSVYLGYFSYKTEMSVYNLISSITPGGLIPPHLEFAALTARNWFLKNILGMEVEEHGPSHGDELSLLFPLHFFTEVRKGSKDYEMSVKMIKLWVDFATDNTKLKFGDTTWPLVNSTTKRPLQYMELSEKESIIDEPFKKRLEFWKSLKLPY